LRDVLIKIRLKITPGQIIGTALVFLLSLFFLFPLFWLISNSFKLQSVTLVFPPEWIPKNPTLSNYKLLFSLSYMPRWIINSFIVSILTMAGVCILSTLAGYGFAKKKFFMSNALFWLMLATMSIPRQVITVPLFVSIRDWGLYNTLTALILPTLGWPFGVFLMKQFTQTLPAELLEAADIDGCGEIGKFIRIVVPLVKPAIAALAIFTFMNEWNNYFWQLVMVNRPEMETLPVGIAGLQQENETNYGLLMAGGAIASIPMIVIFVSFQKYFTKGITMGAIKG
jgi:multiple sugar transport system permease protein